MPAQSPPDPAYRAIAVLLFVVGLVLGVVSGFLVPLRLFGGVEGLSVVLALLGTVLLGLLGGWGTGRAPAAVIPGAGWFVGVAALNLYLPGGDIIIPGSLPVDPGITYVGYGFLLAGVVGTVAALTITTRRLNRRRRTATPGR